MINNLYSIYCNYRIVERSRVLALWTSSSLSMLPKRSTTFTIAPTTSSPIHRYVYTPTAPKRRPSARQSFAKSATRRSTKSTRRRWVWMCTSRTWVMGWLTRDWDRSLVDSARLPPPRLWRISKLGPRDLVSCAFQIPTLQLPLWWICTASWWTTSPCMWRTPSARTFAGPSSPILRKCNPCRCRTPLIARCPITAPPPPQCPSPQLPSWDIHNPYLAQVIIFKI